MAFSDTEVSKNDGRPIYLYEFQVSGTQNYWRYCSADVNITANSHLWTAIPIADDGIKQNGDAEAESITITMPNTADVTALFQGTPPNSQVLLRIYHMHYGDTTAYLKYAGEVMDMDRADPAYCEFAINTVSASFDTDGLRVGFSRACPYSLYDDNCSVDKANFLVTLTIDSISGLQIFSSSLTSYGDNWFAGGFIEWTDSAKGTMRRGIQSNSQSSGSLTIYGLVDGITGGMSIKLYPGCGRTCDICYAKFNNLANFGGVPAMPNSSPFDGTQIY